MNLRVLLPNFKSKLRKFIADRRAVISAKAFLVFLFIITLGYLAAWWIQSVANISWGPVTTLLLFVGTPAIIYLIFMYITTSMKGTVHS
jgi:hypothetical protein